MTTVVVGEQPEITDWLERRRALGQDKRDEIWEGIYHVAPLEHPRNGIVASELAALLWPLARQAGLRVCNPFNLGEPNDFRGPDLGLLHQDDELQVYMKTAAVVIEVLSPGDESLQKLPHYARCDVDEVWLVDPETHTVDIRGLLNGDYVGIDTSGVLPVSRQQLEAEIDWP